MSMIIRIIQLGHVTCFLIIFGGGGERYFKVCERGVSWHGSRQALQLHRMIVLFCNCSSLEQGCFRDFVPTPYTDLIMMQISTSNLNTVFNTRKQICKIYVLREYLRPL